MPSQSARTSLLIAAFASLCLATSCSRQSATPETTSVVVVDVDPSAAAELIAKGEVRVLDVRTPEEFALGHIEGAINQNVNGPDFASALEDLPHDKPYLVHCAAGTPGGRSRRATEALQSAGSKRIYHLDGGLIAWSGGGNPTVTVDGDD